MKARISLPTLTTPGLGISLVLCPLAPEYAAQEVLQFTPGGLKFENGLALQTDFQNAGWSPSFPGLETPSETKQIKKTSQELRMLSRSLSVY